MISLELERIEAGIILGGLSLRDPASRSVREKVLAALDQPGEGEVRCEGCGSNVVLDSAHYGPEDGTYLCNSCLAECEQELASQPPASTEGSS